MNVEIESKLAEINKLPEEKRFKYSHEIAQYTLSQAGLGVKLLSANTGKEKLKIALEIHERDLDFLIELNKITSCE